MSLIAHVWTGTAASLVVVGRVRERGSGDREKEREREQESSYRGQEAARYKAGSAGRRKGEGGREGGGDSHAHTCTHAAEQHHQPPCCCSHRSGSRCSAASETCPAQTVASCRAAGEEATMRLRSFERCFHHVFSVLRNDFLLQSAMYKNQIIILKKSQVILLFISTRSNLTISQVCPCWKKTVFVMFKCTRVTFICS